MAEELFSWVVPIPARRASEVETFLGQVASTEGAFEPEGMLPLRTLEQLHFGSLTLVPREGEDPLLIFECSIDKPFTGFVAKIEETCRVALDCIYEGCKGYPALNGTTGDPHLAQARIDYLSSTAIRKRPQLFHIGHPERSVETIAADHRLRQAIEAEFKTDPTLKTQSPAEILRTLRLTARCPVGWSRRWLPSWPGAPTLSATTWKTKLPISWSRLRRAALLLVLAWALGLALVFLFRPVVFVEAIVVAEFFTVFAVVKYTSSGDRIARAFLIALGLALVVYLTAEYGPPLLRVVMVVLLPTAFLLAAYVRIKFTITATRPPPVLNPATVDTLLQAEDQTASTYNHVLGLSTLRPDWTWIRVSRTWLVLWLLNLFYRVEFVRGQLASVPTIHFAHWTLFDNRYLLFNVHYDGGADSYLDDFFESLAQGVGFIWYDTVRYPRVTDPRRLKLWVRESQTLALVRYRAAVYKDLTVAAINNHRYIRRGLLQSRPGLAERWLARFTTTLPRDPAFLSIVDRWMRRLIPIK